jgi:hypothetical protein
MCSRQTWDAQQEIARRREERDLLLCQKRPTPTPKEAYCYAKRDLQIREKRPTPMPKETYPYAKRDLLLCQKRPSNTPKETWDAQEMDTRREVELPLVARHLTVVSDSQCDSSELLAYVTSSMVCMCVCVTSSLSCLTASATLPSYLPMSHHQWCACVCVSHHHCDSIGSRQRV